jgi:hypothetical protein
MTTTDTIPPLAPTATNDAATLETKGSRSAMMKCINAVDDLPKEERTRVIKALAALFGVECP